MISVHDILRERLLDKAGLNEQKKKSNTSRMSFEQLWESQWSPEFEKLMRNRLIMGGLRYGLMGAPGKPQYDRMARVVKNLDRYKETGNTEYLVDSANLILLEFVEGEHPNKHFHSKEDTEHTKEIVK